MGSTTTKGYPYPVGTDRVMDGDNAIQALAQAVDTKLGVAAAGNVLITVNAASTGNVVVTFPVGLFTATPAVTATVKTNAPRLFATGTAAGGTTNVTVYCYRESGTGQVSVDWCAQQTA